jgi:hypothetical protein
MSSNNFKTKIRLSNNKVYQNEGDTLSLSGDTTVNGDLIINTLKEGVLKFDGVTTPTNKFLKLDDEGKSVFDTITQGHVLKNIPSFEGTGNNVSPARANIMADNGIVFKNLGSYDYTTLGINDIIELKTITRGSSVTVNSVVYTKDTFVYEYKDYGVSPNKLKKEIRVYYNNDGVVVRMQYRDELKYDTNNIIEEVYNYDGEGNITTIGYSYNKTAWFDE